MNLKTFHWHDEDDAKAFAKAKRDEGFKTSVRPFNNGTSKKPSTRYIVRWSAA